LVRIASQQQLPISLVIQDGQVPNSKSKIQQKANDRQITNAT